jgi:hypothetical protein
MDTSKTKTRIPLILAGDTLFGTEEWGWLNRLPDPDDEDLAYQRHLKRMGIAARVVEGTIWLMHSDCDNRGGACSDGRNI